MTDYCLNCKKNVNLTNEGGLFLKDKRDSKVNRYVKTNYYHCEECGRFVKAKDRVIKWAVPTKE
jgi:DNA-directed RNA polymerase subunit RPC12/RpoP